MIKTRKENLLYEFKISLTSICKRQDRIPFFPLIQVMAL